MSCSHCDQWNSPSVNKIKTGRDRFVMKLFVHKSVWLSVLNCSVLITSAYLDSLRVIKLFVVSFLNYFKHGHNKIKWKDDFPFISSLSHAASHLFASYLPTPRFQNPDVHAWKQQNWVTTATHHWEALQHSNASRNEKINVSSAL